MAFSHQNSIPTLVEANSNIENQKSLKQKKKILSRKNVQNRIQSKKKNWMHYNIYSLGYNIINNIWLIKKKNRRTCASIFSYLYKYFGKHNKTCIEIKTMMTIFVRQYANHKRKFLNHAPKQLW